MGSVSIVARRWPHAEPDRLRAVPSGPPFATGWHDARYMTCDHARSFVIHRRSCVCVRRTQDAMASRIRQEDAPASIRPGRRLLGVDFTERT